MNKYYFTFGTNHETNSGMSLGRSYVVIEADNEGQARDVMRNARGDIWAFSYTEDDFSGQPEQYGLKELTLEQVRIK